MCTLLMQQIVYSQHLYARKKLFHWLNIVTRQTYRLLGGHSMQNKSPLVPNAGADRYMEGQLGFEANAVLLVFQPNLF